MSTLRTLENLRALKVLPQQDFVWVEEQVKTWNLKREAIDALVALFEAIRDRGLSTFEVLRAWENHGLDYWSVDEGLLDEEQTRINLFQVYHTLRLPIPQAILAIQ